MEEGTVKIRIEDDGRVEKVRVKDRLEVIKTKTKD
jgi:hypothetical protein